MRRPGFLGTSLSLTLFVACGTACHEGENPSGSPIARTFAYVSEFDPYTSWTGLSNRIWSYAVDPATGAWTAAGSVREAEGSVAFHPQGRLLFSGRWGIRWSWPEGYKRRAELATYRLDSLTGALSLASLTNLGDMDATVPIADPAGRFLYVADQSFPYGSTYSIDAVTAKLTLLSWIETVAAESWAIDPRGRCLYLVDWSERIHGYAIDDDGGLRRIGEIAGGERITVDPSGRCLYASRRSTNELVAFAINGATGRLSAIATVPTEPVPGPLVVDASGRFLYLASDEGIAAFRLDPSTGMPAPIGIVAVGVRGDHGELAVHPTAGFLYDSRTAESVVLGYGIDQATGGLDPIGVVSTEGGGWVRLITLPMPNRS